MTRNFPLTALAVVFCSTAIFGTASFAASFDATFDAACAGRCEMSLSDAAPRVSSDWITLASNDDHDDDDDDDDRHGDRDRDDDDECDDDDGPCQARPAPQSGPQTPPDNGLFNTKKAPVVLPQ